MESRGGGSSVGGGGIFSLVGENPVVNELPLFVNH